MQLRERVTKPVNDDDTTSTTSIEKKQAASSFGKRLRTFLILFVFWTAIILATTYYFKYYRRGRGNNEKIKDMREWLTKLPFRRSGGSRASDTYTFSRSDLAHYTGENKDLPILIAIKGKVFDVTRGKGYYGPNGSYHFFAGRDGSRSFSTGCFDPKNPECTEKSHVIDDLTDAQKKDVEGWATFYEEKYDFVGDLLDMD